MAVTTGFDPVVHGYHFTNRFSGKDVVDELVEQRRLDEFIGVDLPSPLENLVGRIREADFWGTWGLCGGMAWGALDAYLDDRVPPPEAAGPPRESALFKQLVKRQADSMERNRLMAKCVKYQVLPETRSRWRPWRASLGKITETIEWPKVKRSLDEGTPVPLCLVRVQGLTNPDSHHQVLATGYRLDGGDRLALFLYDPNHPDKHPEITAHLGTKGHTLQLRQTTGERLYGFFATRYRPAQTP
jgi:hypothetical protein